MTTICIINWVKIVHMPVKTSEIVYYRKENLYNNRPEFLFMTYSKKKKKKSFLGTSKNTKAANSICGLILRVTY